MPTRPTFTTLRVEGAILPPDLLQRVADGDKTLEGLTPEAYHLDKGEKLNEAINRAWNRLLGAWLAFRDAAAKLPEGDVGTTVTRERWLLPLFDELGYGRLQTTKAIEIEGQAYPVSHGWGNVPIHLVGAGVDLDKRTPGVAGAARNSPHSLVQALLNRSDAHLWGLVSNGLRLRVLRDNVRLTRQAYVEFDLQAMMDGQVYSDFVLLWLVCHESRVEGLGVGSWESGVEKTTGDSRLATHDCYLEKWSKQAAEQGTRALDQLRDGVQNAIEALGRGFLAHPSNGALREKLKTRELAAQDYYRQLLRLVYRLIFLFVAEDRGLLLNPDPLPSAGLARERYARFYSTARLRELALKRRGTRHYDLYHALRVVMEKLGDDAGCPELALTARGGDLFAPTFIADLNACEIANRDLLDAVRALAVTKDKFARRTVDFKNLGSIELGSVYESLLELHPILNMDAAHFELRTASGNERKTTGSFYTPDALIDVLLDSALDPVLEDACRKTDAAQAILNLKVCDPAGGSGHIAIAAARRIAKRLATIRTGDDEPSPEALRAALRDVIAHCIYVVDVNPMAVELCKVNLWMEMQDPRKPLSFLDAHIKCGNSLIGVAPHMDISELPDEAFNAVTGDDKKTASALKKRNKQERTGQLGLNVTVLESLDDLARWAAERARRVEQMPEDSPAQVHAKQAAYADYVASENYARKKLEYDLWTAAFFWQMQADARSATILAPTHGELMKLRRGENLDAALVRGAQALAERLRFFHWELEFPEVFSVGKHPEQGEGTRGGFDAILSNPPWEKIQVEEQSFFALYAPQISVAVGAYRKKLIDDLKLANPNLFEEFTQYKKSIEVVDTFIKLSERYPLSGKGKMNTYAVFAELGLSMLAHKGYAGLILPLGIVADENNKEFFAELIRSQRLVSALGFENEEFLFRDVHHAFKFTCVTMAGRDVKPSKISFAFYCRQVDQLSDKKRSYSLSQSDIQSMSPNTGTSPIFRTSIDADLNARIYSQFPVITNDLTGANPWNVSIHRMVNPTDDSILFKTKTELLDLGGKLVGNLITFPNDVSFVPVYEAKMIHQFDHRFGTYENQTEAQANQGKLPELDEKQHANPYFSPFPSASLTN